MDHKAYFQTVPDGKYLILQVEVNTGIILSIDGSRHLGGEEEVYIVCDSLAEARDRVRSVVERADRIECHILDSDGKYLEEVRAYGWKRPLSGSDCASSDNR